MTVPSDAVLADVAAQVRRLIRRRMPASRANRELTDGLPLGPEGVGLDSISTVELLLECEKECGIKITPDLLERGVLTVGALVNLVIRVAADARSEPGST